MTHTYGTFRPTVFDQHLDIQWEPSEELEVLYKKREKLQNRIEDLRHSDNEAAFELRQRQLGELEVEIARLETLEDRNNWLVVPVGQNRDSGPFEQSNFAAALEILGGESESVEVHCFRHWGPGWFEVIIVRPDRAADVDDIEARLESYPLLDEEDLSRREHELMEEDWRFWGRSDFEKSLMRELESLADSLDGSESDIEREVRELRDRNDFDPVSGMTYDMAEKTPPTPAERLRDRILEIEDKDAEWWDKLWREAGGEYWTENNGTIFEAGKAIKNIMDRELFWEDF